MSIDFDKNRSHILQVYNDVLDDKSATDWALFGYEAQTNVIKVVGYGDEGLEEMVEELNASKIMYGIIRLLDPKTSRIKIVLLNWQGEAAPNLRKGVCQRHLHDVKKFFKAFNITFNARTEEDVDMEAVLDAVTKGASTEYNFKDRSEIPDKTVPVGTNYKRTNPVAEIDANRRNKFWEEQEAEERMRKEEEIKKKEEEARRLEKERMERELRDSKQREELNKERNSRILAEKKAEMAAMEITRKRDSVSWEREMVHQRTEEEERARRADQMRMERKKEAESLIGQKTHQARFMFESQSRNTIVTSPATMHSSWNEDSKRGSKPPPRILKEFNPSNVEQNISSPRENSAPRKSVGARWPPPSNMEEITPKAQTKVPGKIAEWAPKTEMPSNSHPQHTNFSQAVIEPVRSPQQPSETVSHPASYSHHTQQTFSQNSSLSNQFFKEEQTISPPHSFSTTPPSASPPGVAPSLSPSHDTPLTHVTASPSSLYSPKSSPSHVITENGSKVKGNGDAQGWCPSSTGQGMKILDPYPTNGTMEERSGDSDVTSPYQDEIDALGSVCMTYEVEGIEYQILPEHGLCARALYDYQAADDTEITFDPGDIITNIDQIDVGWWQGVSALGVFGLFPANYVELINGTKIH